MAIKYKIDILAELKKIGYSSTRIREEKLIGQSYLQQLRHGELVSWKTLDTICSLLECQPADLIEYVKDEEQGCPIKQLVSRTVFLAHKMPKVNRKTAYFCSDNSALPFVNMGGYVSGKIFFRCRLCVCGGSHNFGMGFLFQMTVFMFVGGIYVFFILRP